MLCLFVFNSMCGYNSAATIRHLTTERIAEVEIDAKKLMQNIDRFAKDRKIKLSHQETITLLDNIVGPHYSSSIACFEFRPGERSLIAEIVNLVQRTIDEKGYQGFREINDENADAHTIQTKIGEIFGKKGK